MIETIKNNIKEQMKANNTNTNKVCKVLGVDRRFIYRLTNECKMNKIVDIAHAIDCTTSDLLKGI